MISFWRCLLLAASLVLAGCAAPNPTVPDASSDEIQNAAYTHAGPAKLTLYTMINNRSGAGAHTSVMINASQRVIFDPAGSVRLNAVPERGDVLYGVTPRVAEFYARAHARETFHVVIQELVVPYEVAEQALRLAMEHGPAAGGFCAASTSAVLAKLPGFESINRTFFPKRLMDDFARMPGVKTRKLFENDADDKSVAIAQFEQSVNGTQ